MRNERTDPGGVPALPVGIEESVWDAVIIGAGPAGSLASHELSRLGRRVLLLDREIFPRWKVCGATLSAGVQSLLRDAGLEHILDTSGAQPLNAIRLGGWRKEAFLPLDGVVALSRTSLDSALIQAATEAGATFLPGAKATLGELLPDRRTLSVTVGKKNFVISGRLVVAADGLSGGILAKAGFPSRTLGGKRPVIGLGGVIRNPGPDYPAGSIHMAVGDGGYVGLVRVEDGSLNVAAALASSAVRSAESPAALLNSLLLGAGWPAIPRASAPKWKGTPELTRRPTRLGADRILSVGDASGYVEPFTGEGMFWALSGARLLAPLAAGVGAHWDPEVLKTWENLHRRLVGRAQRICRTTAWCLARPMIARTALHTLSRHPRLAGPMVRRVGATIRTRR